MNRVTTAFHYGVQRLRSGVTPEMIERAADILERPWSDVRRYLEGRIEANYPVGDSSGFDWLRSQPVRTKEHYRRNRAPGGGVNRIMTEQRHTSGSSGRPFTFRRDRSMTAWMDGAMWAVYGWYGIEPGDRMARFWGRPLSSMAAATRRMADLLLRQRRMSAFDVTPERSRSFFRRLLAWNPDYAYGYPTLMEEFTEHIRSRGEDGRRLGLDVVITTGELLRDATRSRLEEFFGCPVADEYGCSESGILSFECHEGQSHLIPVAALAEVTSDGSSEGDVRDGRILITDLYGDVMPFVRYSLDDLGRWSPASRCQCGRDLPCLEVITGRMDGFIVKPDGQKVYDAILAYSVPEGVAQFQVRQTALDELTAKVVVAEGFDPEEVLRACKVRWGEVLGSQMRIAVQAVSDIARHDSGKRRYFIPLKGVDP